MPSRVLCLRPAAFFAVLGLAACGGSATEPTAHSGSAIIKGEQPAAVYAKIARLARNCWFNPTDPVLSRHTFYAKAPADGGTASIIIFEKKSQNKRGQKAYEIEFNRRLKATQIETVNRRLPYALAQKLTADINRWSQGTETCQTYSGSAAQGAAPGSRTSVDPAIGQTSR